ncbi:MAG: FlgO family outer membrane protein [Desulfatiglandaceae bacterium]
MRFKPMIHIHRPIRPQTALSVSGRNIRRTATIAARLRSLASALLPALALTACSPAVSQHRATEQTAQAESINTYENTPYSAVLESSYTAADRLAGVLLNKHFSMQTPILAASFVNIDNLSESSTFGRIISTQLSTRLTQHGFNIIEIKLRQESVFIKEGKGEFMLSRELKDLSDSREIRAVLVGTYAVSEYFIFVSARIVRTKDSSVLAGYDYEVPNDTVTKSILK